MNLSAGSVRVLVAISVFKFTVKIQDKRQEIIHVSDREEIRGDSPVVGLQELVKEVFVVSTVQDCKCRAQGASHCNAHDLASRLHLDVEKILLRSKVVIFRICCFERK